jgi:hypothetical protein
VGKKGKGKKTKEQLLIERIKQEKKASRLLRVPIKFGMSASQIKTIKKALKGK